MSGIEQIRRVIEACPRGSIFFPEDFSSFGHMKMVSSALMRLCQGGTLVRMGQGIYIYPKVDDKWGMGVLLPSIDELAHSIAKRDKSRIVPTGAQAMNLLGLSTQLQANTVYYTDGSPRRVNIGEGKGILFKRSSEMKKFAFENEMMQIIVAALREIGNGQVTDSEKSIITDKLREVPENEFIHDVALAPVWVRQLLKEIR